MSGINVWEDGEEAPLPFPYISTVKSGCTVLGKEMERVTKEVEKMTRANVEDGF